MQEQLTELLDKTVDGSLYQIILSNPRIKDGAFKIKIRPVMIKGSVLYQAEVYEGTKVFHENLGREDAIAKIEQWITRDYRQCAIEHKRWKATVLVSRKGSMAVRAKQTGNAGTERENGGDLRLSHNRVKKHILKEGVPIPFLIDLGVQTKDGAVVRPRYDKFKQINRFLEFIRDILPTLSKERTIRIIDFGCGKSYLTFAIYYYLHELMGYDVDITGLDLKEDVIKECNRLSAKYGYEKLRFVKGDIAEYDGQGGVDMVVALHACDTATDHALAKAVDWGAKVILSVPCCQHEVNQQIHCEELAPLLKYGIIKERMAALITDAVRADLLETKGYETSILEFIDMEHTPKNLLIRAVKRDVPDEKKGCKKRQEVEKVMDFLHISPALNDLL